MILQAVLTDLQQSATGFVVDGDDNVTAIKHRLCLNNAYAQVSVPSIGLRSAAESK
jgi:hypothetical protein